VTSGALAKRPPFRTHRPTTIDRNKNPAILVDGARHSLRIGGPFLSRVLSAACISSSIETRPRLGSTSLLLSLSFLKGNGIAL
jgi:hypothetical protein